MKRTHYRDTEGHCPRTGISIHLQLQLPYYTQLNISHQVKLGMRR